MCLYAAQCDIHVIVLLVSYFSTDFLIRPYNPFTVLPARPQVKEVFTFQHPGDGDNQRFKQIEYTAKISALVHGFMGYFESTLFGDVRISIHPKTYSKGMFSWFPMYFPIEVLFICLFI